MTLKQIRITKGITMAKVAEDCGISKQRYCRIEQKGLKRCEPDVARRIADYFGVNLFEAVGENALRFLPKTEEERQTLLSIVSGVEIA